MKKKILTVACAIAWACVSATAAFADNQTFTAVASGYYGQFDTSANGYTLQNYFAGSIGNDPDNNFFVFDLAGVHGVIQSPSSLQLIIPGNGISAPNGPLEYTLFDVSTPISQLVAGVPSAAIWQDLGSGTVYGSATLTEGDAGTVFVVSFNSAAIDALNNASGGMFAIGGSITNLDGQDGYAFGYTNNHEVAQLQLDPVAPVPEPMSALLMAGGLVTLVLRRRRN